MDRFDDVKMFTYIRGFAQGAKMANTLKALNFAREAHKGQKRKSGDPYVVHPLTMACHALSMGIRDDTIIAACLLHDVVEDCGVKVSELPVDEHVRHTVKLLTHVKPCPLEAYYHEIQEDCYASIVKLIDRCNNVSTMAGVFTTEKLLSYIQETKEYVLPLIRSTKDRWPEFGDVLFVMKYHICALIDGLEICYDTVSFADMKEPS